MTRFRVIRMAWAATAVAGVSAVAYIALMPMTGSVLTHFVISGAVLTAAAFIGAVVAYRVENAIRTLRPQGAPESDPSGA